MALSTLSMPSIVGVSLRNKNLLALVLWKNNNKTNNKINMDRFLRKGMFHVLYISISIDNVLNFR